MKIKSILVLLILLSVFSFNVNAQKQFLQRNLTKSVVSSFFNVSNDNISMTEGIYDEEQGCYFDACIEGYSSEIGAEVTLESNIEGKIGSIVISYRKIVSIERYNVLVNQYLSRNVGIKWSETGVKDIKKTYTLIDNTWRNDILTIRGTITSVLTGEGKISSYCPAKLLLLFNSGAL
ncbi:hypothetical protein ACXR6G_03570 [Ancylomarina sp. YFZ004]